MNAKEASSGLGRSLFLFKISKPVSRILYHTKYGFCHLSARPTPSDSFLQPVHYYKADSLALQ